MKNILLKIFSLPTNFLKYIKAYAEFASIKTPMYNYAIVELQPVLKKNIAFSIIAFRAIGSRQVHYIRASDIDPCDAISNYSPEHAKIIIQLSTMEKVINDGILIATKEYMRYVEKCSKQLK